MMGLIMFINLFVQVNSIKLQFNSKMSRKNSEKPQPVSNYTDQRLMQIMKKYQQPNKTSNTPLAVRQDNQLPPQDSFKKHLWNKESSFQTKVAQQSKSINFSSNFYKQNSNNDGYHKRHNHEKAEDKTRESKPFNKKETHHKTQFDEVDVFEPSNQYKQHQEQILDAKQFLKRKQRKYLKTEATQAISYKQQRGSVYPQKEQFYKPQPQRNPYLDREEYILYGNRPQEKRPQYALMDNKHQYVPSQKVDYLRKKDYAQQQEEIGWRKRNTSPISSYHVPKTEVDYAPRISNIERINNKIKSLLDPNHNVPLETPRNQNESFRLNFKNEICSTKIHNQRFEATPIKGRTVTPNKIDRAYDAKPTQFLLKEQSIKAPNKIEERSKSCLTLKKNVMLPASQTPRDKFKLNQQINKFNNKIAEFQQQKRKMNITFKTFQKPQQNLKTLEDETINDSFGEEKVQLGFKCKTEGIQLFQQEEQQFVSSPYIGLKCLDSQVQSAFIDLQQGEPVSSQIAEVAKGIEFRKKRMSTLPCQSQSIQNSESKRLLEVLAQQVQLDSQFRLTKNWFTNSSQPSDLSLLQDLLCQRWREMSLQQVANEFRINFEEEDPFYSYRPDDFQIEDLVANYIICNKHWCDNIEGKWNVDKLKSERFFERLDLQRKGHLQMEDLVRQINMNQGVFFRNRDLYLVLQRFELAQGEMLSEERMYDLLGQK